MPVIFSGIQPSGVVHLGNYLGAIKNWIDLQWDNSCLFCIADLHSITAGFPPSRKLLQDTIVVAAHYIACGIDPTKSLIFNQSSVFAHSELCWILSCLTSLGWLNRMTQFKDKSESSNVSLGLFSYPVLMSADILLYKTDLVPVGDDQKQHLELSQKIASAFNSNFKKDFFPIPKALIPKKASRIMSLRDGKKKMSKSDNSDYSRINLNDSNEIIAKKIQKATTDSSTGFDFETISKRTEIHNMLEIYSALSNKSIKEVCESLEGYSMSSFKKQLSDLLISSISPIREKSKKLLENQDYVIQVLQEGNEKAREISIRVITEVKKIVGFFA